MSMVVQQSLSRKQHVRTKVQSASTEERKPKGPTFIPGEYKRSRSYFHLLEYCNGLGDRNRVEVLQRLIFTSILNDDRETLEKISPSPLDDIAKYERDEKWETLSLNKKREELSKPDGRRPMGKRYELELIQLSEWTNDMTEDDVYARDLVGIYRSLPEARRRVGWNVTTKCCKIGEATDKALIYLSFNILLHQILHEGLVPTRSMIISLIKREIELPFLTSLLLHTANPIQPGEWPYFMLQASLKGLLEFVSYMAQCGTMPNQKDRTEIITQLVIRSQDKTAIAKDEKVNQKDRARVARALIADKMEALGDVKEASRLRSIRVPEGEERERFEEEKRKKKQREEEEQRRKEKKDDTIINLDEIDFDDEE